MIIFKDLKSVEDCDTIEKYHGQYFQADEKNNVTLSNKIDELVRNISFGDPFNFEYKTD